MGRMDGQGAVITRAGSGIARAAAIAFAPEACRVALVGRRPEPGCPGGRRRPILPQRAAVELLTVFPPQQRDGSDEVG